MSYCIFQGHPYNFNVALAKNQQVGPISALPEDNFSFKIHRLLWNGAQIFEEYTRGALLFFKVIDPIQMTHR